MPTSSSSARRTRRAVGEQVMDLLLANDDLAELVAERIIERKLASGELLRAESLMVGPGLELAPAGTTKRQLDAIYDALDHLDIGAVQSAIAALEAAIPDEPKAEEAEQPADEAEEPEPSGEGEEPAPEPPPTPISSKRRARAQEDQAVEERPVPGRPKDFPVIGQEYECLRPDADGDPCGAMMSGKQAQLSVTRFRVKLCESCMAEYDPVREGLVRTG